MNPRIVQWLLLGVFGLGLVRGAEPAPQNAVRGLVQAFDRYPVVAIGESHWLLEAGEFYVALVKDPAFQSKVNDIVVEFGSSRSQPVVDRYVTGGDVPMLELQHVWRDTTKVFSWESPIYPKLLEAVREVNRTLPRNRQLRVLAGDSPIDWSKVHNAADWGAFQPNNVSFASVINQSLAKKRKVLVILGGNHLTKGGDRDRGPDTTTLVEAKHPGSVYVAALISTSVPEMQRMGNWTTPALFSIKGTWAASIKYGKRELGDSADALLYLGSGLTKAYPDWSIYQRDPEYMKEVDRRWRIQHGCGFDLRRVQEMRPPCS